MRFRLRPVRRAAATAAFALALACAAAPAGRAETEPLSLRDADFTAAAGVPLLSPEAVRQFYAARGWRPAWPAEPDDALRSLQEALEAAGDHGLDPADYHPDALARAVWDGDRRSAELLATDAYLTLGAHLLRGKVEPASLEPSWNATRRAADLIAELRRALATGRVHESLNALAPQNPSYAALQVSLRDYKRAAEAGGWPSVPAGPTLKRGREGPRVQALRLRLAAGDLLDGAYGEAFDEATERAVMEFQRSVGLDADGIVGPATLREINRSAAAAAAKVAANLERWRWLEEDLGDRHIRVNIAAYRLEAWAAGMNVATHDVIVGRPYRRTPVFSHRISYIILNPWWETPNSIARKDKLPELRADAAGMSRLGFEVIDREGKRRDPTEIDWRRIPDGTFPYRLRQRPGPNNALGAVKLMFPNQYNVYLHDTPARELFQRERRDFSSGCIRVRRALDLAAWVLVETPGWPPPEIESIVHSGRETRIDLAKKVPVHIMYMTAEWTPEGGVRFLPDIYDRDARLIAALSTSARK